jgi:hypothetical protein
VPQDIAFICLLVSKILLPLDPLRNLIPCEAFLSMIHYEQAMGIRNERRAGSTVCQVGGCSISAKWQAILNSTGKPIRLCGKHESEYSQKGLTRDSVRV